MKHFMKPAILVLAIVLGSNSLFAQQAAKPDPSSRYRKIFTPSGAAGGFAAGLMIGLTKFDDDVNSDRKVWTSALVGSAAGGIGGYFLGRILDKRRDRAALTYPQRRVDIAPLVSSRAKGVQVSVSF
jgi:hypothetical protein